MHAVISAFDDCPIEHRTRRKSWLFCWLFLAVFQITASFGNRRCKSACYRALSARKAGCYRQKNFPAVFGSKTANADSGTLSNFRTNDASANGSPNAKRPGRFRPGRPRDECFVSPLCQASPARSFLPTSGAVASPNHGHCLRFDKGLLCLAFRFVTGSRARVSQFDVTLCPYGNSIGVCMNCNTAARGCQPGISRARRLPC